MTQRTEGAAIRFDAVLSTIDTSAVLRLPETASKDLPSRGQVAVRGTINGVEFRTVLEPDGNLGAAPQEIQDLWNEITPMARREWVRWVNATKNPDTRRRRVDVSQRAPGAQIDLIGMPWLMIGERT